MLQPHELKKPIKIPHGRHLDVQLLRDFFKAFKPGEDKYRLWFWTAIETGARAKELCSIQEADYTPDYRKLTMVTCKSPKVRHITLSPQLAAFTRRWCEGNRQRFQYGYIFPTSSCVRYQHLQTFQVRGFLQMKRRQLGLKPIHVTPLPHPSGWSKTAERRRYALECHSFRRFYETHLTDLASGNYMLIASIMQYDDPGIVRRYYDDMKSITAEEVLSAKYHERITQPLLHDRPIVSRKQKTINKWHEKPDDKNVWQIVKELSNDQ